jgi:hypothetical protein
MNEPPPRDVGATSVNRPPPFQQSLTAGAADAPVDRPATSSRSPAPTKPHALTRTMVWQGGEHAFGLSVMAAIALEDACDCGVAHLMRKLETDTWTTKEVREIVRRGLMGAGMPPAEADKLVKRDVDGNPNGLAPSVVLAHAIIELLLVGPPKATPVAPTDHPPAEQPQADQLPGAV